ncbi:S9 family peptidase [Candidatus Acetothermia bacterium]|nr:S9 family peptidase [Candidatus Acetothermia bacterium]MBI3660741.1 S9 family peptidase [Candidatus Acetothermia bacterium]
MPAAKPKTKKDDWRITPEDFYEIKFASEPQISPGGSTIAYTQLEPDYENNSYKSAIWVVTTAGGEPQKFTSGEKRDHSPRWSPDGNKLAFVSNRTGKNQIYVIDSYGGEAWQLTRMPNGVSDPAWSPDGTKLVFISRTNDEERKLETERDRRPPERLDAEARKKLEEEHKKEEEEKADPRVITRIIYRAETRYRDDRNSHVYVVDLKEKKAKRLTSGERDYVAPVWEPSGQSILASVKRVGDPDNSTIVDVVRIPAKGGKLQLVVRTSGYEADAHPSPDGKWIAYMMTPEKRTSAQNSFLMIVSAKGGTPRNLTESLDRSVNSPAWSHDSRSIYCLCADQGDVSIRNITLSDGKIETIVSGRRSIQWLDVSNTSLLTYMLSAPDIPSDIFTARADGSKEKRLTEVNKEFLSKKKLSKPEEIWYESFDGKKIQGWLFKPADFDPKKKYPLLLEIHGGPHVMWGMSERTMWHEWQTLAAAGYVVFACNPRGSDGYGYNFKDAIHLNWGEEDAQDILTGVDHVVKKAYIDAKKMVITGGSYGGFMTAWIIGHDQRFAAAFSQRGVYNLTSFYGCTDATRLIEWEFDSFPWDEPDLLWKHSPIAYVKNIKTPLLIKHGDLDFRAPINTAEELYMALKKLGREVVFVRYPREGHELSRSGEPKHRIDRLNRMLDWFNSHIGRKPKKRKAV